MSHVGLLRWRRQIVIFATELECGRGEWAVFPENLPSAVKEHTTCNFIRTRERMRWDDERVVLAVIVVLSMQLEVI